ncbi:Platelet-activating factor acetylhydrolase [Pleurostoma richardsiae]|uniref:1-alkyl-2-acetylglycerophosphocholine esterase n=1 Tax=Pleurostoma richardsiae TaxID=41990 RepID=A0AA38VK09_9PEZI|nr:Platelet-activating factor acetylhydrolase [Pleurostoma richardsiae]
MDTGRKKQKQKQEHDQQDTRPPPLPKTWREHIFHALPPYSGPYGVGYMEVELPADQPRTFSQIKREHRPALRLDTVLFSVYYPSERDPGPGEPDQQQQGHRPGRRSAAGRVPWLPRPRVQTCKGYAKFLSIPYLPVTAYIAGTSMFTKLPAFRNARLAARSPRAGSSSGENGAQHPEKKAEEESEPPVFSVIVLSHGLGGSRTFYSSVCGELASYGFVVVALEHRDGSGARTYVNVPRDRACPEVASQRRRSSGATEGAGPGPLAPESGLKETRDYYMVDYIFPKNNPLDTSPHSEQGVDIDLRRAQIEMRFAEIEEAYKALRMINEGRGEEVATANLRRKGNKGASSRGLEGIQWDEWAGRLHLENVTVAGHSFGGATAVQILRSNRRFGWVGQGILLDPWGPATPAVPESAKEHINKPLLSVGSEAFMHWRANYDAVEEICREARAGGAPCWMLTIRGSTHLSQTDFAVLYPHWMSWFIKTLINHERAITLTNTAVLEFLKAVLPPEQTKFRTSWVSEGLLETPPTALESADASVVARYKPDEKWIAARLKIDHELSVRTKRWAARHRRAPDGVPRDASGKPLVGLKNWGPGNEIWMHLSPDEADGRHHAEQPERVASSGGVVEREGV